jgi:5'-3' exonuclease
MSILGEETKTDKPKFKVDNEHLKFDTSNMTLLIDADTLAYATCSSCEYGDDENGWYIDIPSALVVVIDKIDNLLEVTGCKDVELHFTSGKNFRYLLTDYKANRKDTRAPTGLGELKKELDARYPGAINTEYEADDIVCMLKREYPDKYLVCAVDKDVLYGVAGVHFNYYSSLLHDINMKWIITSEKVALHWPYLQTLMGDSSDGIQGIPRCGPAKAVSILCESIASQVKVLQKEYKVEHEKACPSNKLIERIVIKHDLLEDLETDEVELWNKTLEAYTLAGLDESLAVLNMRLVGMHQLTKEKELELWTKPIQ